MKKILITSFAVAAMAIGGGVFVRTALVQSDPILEANVEALTSGEISDVDCDPLDSECKITIRDSQGNLYKTTLKGLANRGIFVR